MCARLVEIAFQQEQIYAIVVGATLVEDSVCAPQLEAAMSVVLGLQTEQVNVTVTRAFRRANVLERPSLDGASSNAYNSYF